MAFDYVIKPFVFERIQTSLRSFQQLENRLNRGADQIDQKELDRLLQVQQKETSTNDLPKGLNPQTLQQVKNLLGHAASPLSSVETAQALKISRITARRYLEYLVAAGEATLELEYQKVGRPNEPLRAEEIRTEARRFRMFHVERFASNPVGVRNGVV